MNERVQVYEEKMKKTMVNLDGELWNHPCRTVQIHTYWIRLW